MISNKNHLEVYLNQFNALFDVMVLIETYITFDKDLYSLDGNDMLYNNGNFNKADGIVLLYKKKD